MAKKTNQLLAYIISKHPHISVTSLMKLSYLIDLVHIKKTNKKISDFQYARYKYGPFDHKIYNFLKELVDAQIIIEDADFTPFGDEYVIYQFNDKNQEKIFDELSEPEKETIDEVVSSLNGLGAKALVELAYRTKPMKKIGATIGGDENLNVILDLHTN